MPRLFTLLQRFALARRCTNILFPNQPGWYRIATMPNVNSWIMLMSICKGYNTNGSNSALVALAGQYDTGRIQVLMPARTNATGIKQLRILYKPESPIIIDGYYDDDRAGYSNSISFTAIGGVHIYYPPHIADINFETDATPSTIPPGYTAITADLTIGGGIALPIERWWQHEGVHHLKAACWSGEVWRRLATGWGYPDAVGCCTSDGSSGVKRFAITSVCNNKLHKTIHFLSDGCVNGQFWVVVQQFIGLAYQRKRLCRNRRLIAKGRTDQYSYTLARDRFGITVREVAA